MFDSCTAIPIPNESSEVTNRIVGKQEENSMVLAECIAMLELYANFLIQKPFLLYTDQTGQFWLYFWSNFST